MKFVIAPGAIKTEIPKIAADTTKPKNADESAGMLDPIAMQIRIRESGTPLSNLAKIGFSQTLKFEERITQENGDNILMENEAGRVLVEAPYEGVKISDISTLYPKESVSDLQEHVGRTMILNYPASVQSGV